MKKLKNILFLLILTAFILVMSVALLLPDQFYEQISDRLFSPDTTTGPTPTTPVERPKQDSTSTTSTNQPNSPQPPNKTPTQISSAKEIPAKTEIIEGMDWRLPSYAQRSVLGGLVSETHGPLDYVRGDFYIVRWDRTNPKRNQYDFSELQRQIDARPNQHVVLRPEIYSRCEAPGWALKELRYTRNGSLVFWDAQYLKILKPYIQQLATFVKKNPQIVGVQLGIGDGEYRGDCSRFELKDGWGEFNMTPQELLEAETDFGFNPAVLESSTKNIVTAFANAFDKHTSKLIFNNADQFSWQSIAKPYNQRMPAIAQFVMKRGLGNRDGQIEHWMRYIHKIYGMELHPASNNTCTLDMNEAVAEKVANRYWGTENEFYGDLDYVRNEHGNYQNQPYRFWVSSLRALQMRRNYSLIFARAMKDMDHPVYKTQAFLRYLDKTMGKFKQDTPDLFILLGERYVADYRLAKEYPERKLCQVKDRTAIRSFGRWMTESSNSKPTMRIHMPAQDKYWGQDFYLPNGIDYEYAARASNEFAFNINEQLGRMRCKKQCKVVIKLSYQDSYKSKIWLQTLRGKTKTLKTQGDGKVRTASFEVDLPLDNSPQKNDFWVKSESAPLNLMMVRINLLKP
ncbi:MAG: hypothetical protein CSB47_04850 [Proteobacteria bacterium]|nr:MAG: hypothetical protein CSB47_04850 [Pseudomonadota bacterium]